LPANSYFQEYVRGVSAGAVFVAAAGYATLLGITRQLTGRALGLSSPFVYAGSIGPLNIAVRAFDQLSSLGHSLASQTGLCGLFNVDFILNEQGVWILEVNPRYSASIEVLEGLSDHNYIEAHVAACREYRVPSPPPAHKGAAGKAVVYADRDAEVSPAFDELVYGWNPAGQPPGIADLPRIGQRVSAGDPVATVLVESDSEQAVERTLRSRVAEVLATLR
jgi:uncharacterized protein